jgi:hypothetical protein
VQKRSKKAETEPGKELMIRGKKIFLFAALGPLALVSFIDHHM